jgi:hypothetical protein
MGFEVTTEDIQNRFGFHPATDETRPMHQEIRACFTEFADFLNERLPAGREKSLALTALQEAAMWSNAAVACNLASTW